MTKFAPHKALEPIARGIDGRVVLPRVVTLMDGRVIERDARVTLEVHRVRGILLIGAPPKRAPPPP